MRPFLVSFVIGVIGLTLSSRLSAQVVGSLRETESQQALWIARGLMAEGGNETDSQAIIGVLRNRLGMARRAGTLLSQVARRYMVPLHAGNMGERARHISSLRWDEIPDRFRVLGLRAARGEEIPDPCQGQALHWGSQADVRRKRIPDNCRLDCGHTYNVFLRCLR